MIPLNRLEIGVKDITEFIRGHFKSNTIQILEEEFAEYIGSDYALFTSSCRSALYLTYKALKLSGEVVAPPLTCSVALQPIVCCGLKIRFADIDPLTLNINPNETDKNATKDACAIQVIHLAGNPCDMKPIKEIAEDHNLLLIEDCAQALGAEYKGKKVGSFGDIACFSLTKNLFGIRGGMIVSNEREYISKIREIQRELPKAPYPPKYYFFFREYLDGMKGNFAGDLLYTMLSNFRRRVVGHEEDCRQVLSRAFLNNPTNIEAAVSLSQFRMLPTFLKRRVRNAMLLSEMLKGVGIETQRATDNSKHVFTRYMIKVNRHCADMIPELNERGIGTRHLTDILGVEYQTRFDKNPLYSHFAESIKNCENYLQIHDHIVTLPISSNMRKEEIIFMRNILDDVLNNLT